MKPCRLALLSLVLVMTSQAIAEEPVAQPPLAAAPPNMPAPTPSTSSGTVPIGQLLNDQAGAAFLGQTIVVEGSFVGTSPTSAPTDPFPIPKAYRQQYGRVLLMGDSGAMMNTFLVPNDFMTPFFTMAPGTRVQLTGELVSILPSSSKVVSSATNRVLVVTKPVGP
ncbi:MAG: hypothetical protein V4773_03960 [Verrucomicrobiota bacterium]